MGDTFVDHFKKYIKPTLDADVASGAILMYNFDSEDIHAHAPGGYNLAILYPIAEAVDTYFARLEIRSMENPAIGQVISSLTVAEAHRDSFSKTVSFPSTNRGACVLE